MMRVYLLCVLALHAAANNFTASDGNPEHFTYTEFREPAICKHASLAGYGENCHELVTPESQGWSGGFCLASIAEAGWFRSAILNPVQALVLATDVAEGVIPVAVGSNSGGSMFAIRYFTLRSYPIATKWSYPCYLLTDPYKNVCYFHSNFGAISNECFSEAFNVITMSVSMVYGGVSKNYGGPMGVAQTYLNAYFPFISNLPLRQKEMRWNTFVEKYVLMNTYFGLPSNWLVAHTLVSPLQAGTSQYNFGYDSYLSRCTRAYWVQGRYWHENPGSNLTVAWVGSASTNTNTGYVMMPFSLAGKSWDGTTNLSPAAPIMKLFALCVSFVMTKRLIRTHQVLAIDKHLGGSGCTDGCPVMDGGYTDNAPLTPVVSASSMINPNRPAWFLSVGAVSTMSTIKYLMGAGPMEILTMAGVNVCPFTVGGICTMISKIRDLTVGILPQSMQKDYHDLGSSYGVYRPEIKLMAPYCGDPLSYDLFDGMCHADSVCDMWTTIIPSKINQVDFTPEIYAVVFVMAFLQQTPVAARFVRMYMPQDMWAIQYYEHMDQWFPNFDAVSPNKGGIGFTNIAGNSFMDYMTYLNLRLVRYLFETKRAAHRLTRPDRNHPLPECDYNAYKNVASQTSSEPEFLAEEVLQRVPQPFQALTDDDKIYMNQP